MGKALLALTAAAFSVCRFVCIDLLSNNPVPVLLLLLLLSTQSLYNFSVSYNPSCEQKLSLLLLLQPSLFCASKCNESHVADSILLPDCCCFWFGSSPVCV
jgi:hypothetical protein